MKILSIETSGFVCGVALSIENKIVAEYNSFTGNEHDKFLAEYIRRILKDADMEVHSLDAVAVSAGPGSFTGVRIGGAIAKSLCYGGSPKLIAVPTLDAIASSAASIAHSYTPVPERSRSERNASISYGYENICVCIKSHKDLVYYRLYDSHGTPQEELFFAPFSEVEAKISENTMLCGNGFSTEYGRVFFSDGVKASIIADYADKLYGNNEFTDADQYEPTYVQEFTPNY